MIKAFGLNITVRTRLWIDIHGAADVLEAIAVDDSDSGLSMDRQEGKRQSNNSFFHEESPKKLNGVEVALFLAFFLFF